MHQHIFRLLLAAVPLLSVFTLHAQERQSIFKIGVMLCLTGVCAETGTASLRGIELAVEEVNKSGGVLGRQISLTVQDTQEWESSRHALTAFRSLRFDPDVKFFIGPTWTGASLALIPLVQQTKDMIIVSPSSGTDDFSRAADNIFNLWPRDTLISATLANEAIERGWRRAAIFSAQDPWAVRQQSSFSREFAENGGAIVSIVDPQSLNQNLKTESLKIASVHPDVVLFTLWSHMPIAAKELRRLGYRGAFMAVQMDEERVAEAQGALEGTIFGSFPNASSDFVHKYAQHYQASPGIAADAAFDSVQLYARAITVAQSFDPLVVKSFITRSDFDGSSGHISFDENRGIVRIPKLRTVRNGKLNEEDKETS